MRGPSSKFPDEPCVDRAKSQPALTGKGARAFYVLQQPRDFGGGKISVYDEASLASDDGRMAVGLESVAVFRRTAILPHDGVVDGPAGLASPQQSGLALIGDTDGGNLLGGELGLAQGGLGGGELGFPNRLRIMLHPAGLREDLRELLLRHGLHAAGAIENNRARTGRALVECENVFHNQSALYASAPRMPPVMGPATGIHA